MAHLLKISDAASLALHSMAFLASREDRLVSVKEIAKRLKGSEAHLSKVLQRLSRVGLVRSVRGPRGGFMLGKPASQITLLEIYEAIEGPILSRGCLFETPICDGVQCIWSDLLEKISKEVVEYLKSKRLSEFTNVFQDKDDLKI